MSFVPQVQTLLRPLSLILVACVVSACAIADAPRVDRAQTPDRVYAGAQKAASDGIRLTQAGDWTGARRRITEAKERFLLLRLPEDAAGALEALADKLLLAGKLQESAATLEEALAVLTPHLHPGSVYRITWRLALTLSRFGDLTRATAFAKQNVDLVERYGPIPANFARTSFHVVGSALQDLAWIHFEHGLYQEALKHAQTAFDRRAQDRLRSATVGRIMLLMGITRIMSGDIARGEEELKRLLRLSGAEGERLGVRAYVMLGLGLASIARGQYSLALDQLQDSLNRSGTGDDWLAQRGAVRSALGLVNERLNRLADAHRHLDEAIAELRELRYEGRLDMALVMKGVVFLKERRFREAAAVADEALDSARGRNALRGEAQALLLKGWALGELDEDGGARAALQSSQALARRIGAEFEDAMSTLVFAKFLTRTRQHAEAETQLRAAHGLIAGRYRMVEWEYWHVLGRLREDQDRLDEALEAYERAVRAIEALRGAMNTLELRASFVEDKQAVYEALIRLLVRRSRWHDAFQYMERSKGTAFLDLLAEKQLKTKPLGEVPAATLEHEARISEAIFRREREAIPGALLGAPENRQFVTRQAAELRALEDGWRDAHASLRGKVRVYERHPDWSPVSVQQLQAGIPEGTAILVYYLGQRSGWGLYLDRASIRGWEIELPPAVLGQLVIDLRRETVPAGGAMPPGGEGWRRSARDLYRALVAPAEGLLHDVRHIVVLPHGPLHYLPFSALLQADGAPLIARVSLSVLPNGTLLRLDPIAGDRRGGQALGVANPLVPGLPALPGAEQEVRALAGVYRVEVVTGAAATKPTVTALLPGQAAIHFATHADLDRLAPLRSSLRLSPSARDDGRLTVDEIFDLDLAADLVVLSACDTGLGLGLRGDRGPATGGLDHLFPAGDEIVGLTRAFLYAGAGSILATLWPVDDDATAALMSEFYRNLTTMPKAEALRHAQLAVMNAGGPALGVPRGVQAVPKGGATSHPFYWASFVLMGDGR